VFCIQTHLATPTTGLFYTSPAATFHCKPLPRNCQFTTSPPLGVARNICSQHQACIRHGLKIVNRQTPG
jgi:hypothetical protein